MGDFLPILFGQFIAGFSFHKESPKPTFDRMVKTNPAQALGRP